jgi:hypothetical protein
MLGDFFSHTLDDPFGAQCEAVRAGRYGMIEISCGRLVAIYLRPWPRIVSVVETDWLGRRWHERCPGDRCLLYYNQPRRHSNYLALKYVVSQRDCTLATFRRAATALDEVARIKRSDAILCDAWNERISDRLLAREGWQPHKPQRWHRNYIKRFYGVYPQMNSPAAASLRNILPATVEC